jgi:RNase P subunit RPR2
MKTNLSKTETEKEIKEFFENVKNKNSKDVKKIKKLAANKKIPLKEKRKLFCKHCLNPYSGKEKIRIKNKIKDVECMNCEKINRWEVK